MNSVYAFIGPPFLYILISSSGLLHSTAPFTPNYWALVTTLVPLMTALGNLLVIQSVFSEKILRTSTNFLIVSLAVADLLVACLVMPWAIYVLVSWSYSCQCYVAGQR